tara:strand:+ start:2768 stop:3745 length:978 start_codon:yes stop_codon:yes gene_type:complete
MITSIIPIRNEEKYIESCLDSILNQDYDNQNEIIVVDGCSNDGTLKILEKYKEIHDNINIISNHKIFASHGLNLGIKNSTGEIIFRFDAHAFYPSNYISECVRSLKKLKADNIGGIIKTKVKNSNPKTESIATVLSDIMGVGNSKFRIGLKNPKKSKTVPFGCFKREVFSKYGMYNERLKRNQDIELNQRINQKGGIIYLMPNVYSIYFARETFYELFLNNFLNGFWNVKTVLITKNLSIFSVRHFIPAFLLIMILFFLFGYMYSISLTVVFSYLLLILFRTFMIKNNSNSLIYLFISFLVVHISYGAGIIFSPFYYLFTNEKNS